MLPSSRNKMEKELCQRNMSKVQKKVTNWSKTSFLVRSFHSIFSIHLSLSQFCYDLVSFLIIFFLLFFLFLFLVLSHFLRLYSSIVIVILSNIYLECARCRQNQNYPQPAEQMKWNAIFYHFEFNKQKIFIKYLPSDEFMFRLQILNLLYIFSLVVWYVCYGYVYYIHLSIPSLQDIYLSIQITRTHQIESSCLVCVLTKIDGINVGTVSKYPIVPVQDRSSRYTVRNITPSNKQKPPHIKHHTMYFLVPDRGAVDKESFLLVFLWNFKLCVLFV